MTSIKMLSRIAAALLIASLFAVPGFAARGQADFTRFVALGDSYGAGVSNASINERHQAFSWPAILARQANAPDFVQPLVSFPGLGPELQLLNVLSFPPVIQPAAGSGQPLLLNFPRPYNNLSVPGAAVQDMTRITGASPNVGPSAAQFILRGLGTPVQQALAQQPTFVAVWIGGNDLLGAVLSGTPDALTPTDSFRTAYNAMLDQLVAGAPGAGMIVGNLPTNPNALPLLNTVPPFIVDPATRQPVLGPDGQPIFFIYESGPGLVAQLPPGSVVLLPAAARLASGVGIPPTLRNVPPFNLLPNVGTPLSGAEVLTPDELAAIGARAAEYNGVIQQAAQQRDIPVADIKGLFDRFATPGGMRVGPFTFSPAYITGGLFSFDGFHLTDIGYMFFANEYIRTINREFDTAIPVASLAQFFQDNGAFFGQLIFTPEFEMSREAADSILRYATQPQTRGRVRAAR
ncbi:MAG TPA: SGNH/GDSL hydrolase family protein [Thermoanaerobaculia bacterium]|nr:SGNH/GDSL hydrolase family protein [Thermoanaerobaculia bacterium]